MSSPPLNPLATNLQMTQVNVDPTLLTNLPVYANWEYTNSSVANAYAADIQAFVNIFNLGSTTNPDGSITPNRVNQALAEAVSNAIFGSITTIPNLALTTLQANNPALSSLLNSLGLLKLSQTLVESPPSSAKYYGLTVSMANNLDQLLRSLQAVGWDGTINGPKGLLTIDSSGNYTILDKWRDMSIASSSIQGILQQAVGAVSTNRSLQSTIETVYVATANDLISNKLGDLEQQLSNSQDVLDSLSSIQNIHNRIVVSGKGSINFVYNVNFQGGNDDFAKAYAAAASAHFGQPIIPHVPTALVIYGTPPLTGQLAILAQQQNDLKAQIDAGMTIINQQIQQMTNIYNTVIPSAGGKTIGQIYSEYMQANKTYQLTIDQPGNLTDAQLIQAQQNYLNAANLYNQVFWQDRIWPPNNSEGSSMTPPSTATNPPSALKDSSIPSFALTATIFVDYNANPPTTRQLTVGELLNYGAPFGQYAGEYMGNSVSLWNNVLKDNYNNFVSQMNNRISALNDQIGAYNDANPTLPQLAESADLEDFKNALSPGNGPAIGSPAPDGSNFYRPNNATGTGTESYTWASFTNSWTGNQQGSGMAYPGTSQIGTPFSAIPTKFGGVDDHGDDLNSSVNNVNTNAQLPQFNRTGNNNVPFVNTVKEFGYYDKEGRPILSPQSLTAEGQQVLNDLLTQRGKLLSQITFLETVTPKIQTTNGATFDPNSLIVKLRKVVTDMNNTLSANGVPLTMTSPEATKLKGFVNWIMDSYDKTTNSEISKQGAIQQAITVAITASQTTNDSQKTQVQQFMFIFEEYYKSAAAILTKITEIIEKIAQGIAR